MTLPTLTHYITFNTILFFLSAIGIAINRNNILNIIMLIEIIFISISTNFLVFSTYFKNLTGDIFVLFLLSISATEAAIGLALTIFVFNIKGNINITKLSLFKV